MQQFVTGSREECLSPAQDVAAVLSEITESPNGSQRDRYSCSRRFPSHTKGWIRLKNKTGLVLCKLYVLMVCRTERTSLEVA